MNQEMPASHGNSEMLIFFTLFGTIEYKVVDFQKEVRKNVAKIVLTQKNWVLWCVLIGSSAIRSVEVYLEHACNFELLLSRSAHLVVEFHKFGFRRENFQNLKSFRDVKRFRRPKTRLLWPPWKPCYPFGFDLVCRIDPIESNKSSLVYISTNRGTVRNYAQLSASQKFKPNEMS